MPAKTETAVIAGGCFWGMEKYLAQIEGVLKTRVGYTGGTFVNPTYELVCTGMTGHAEAVEIVFDPAKVSYEELLVTFFTLHDPTTLNRQGPDVGSQYRSAIFYHSNEQEDAAKRAVAALDKAGVFKHRIVTQIAPAGEFYAAEDYHQKYLKKNPGGYCSITPGSAKIAQVLREQKSPSKS